MIKSIANISSLEKLHSIWKTPNKLKIFIDCLHSNYENVITEITACKRLLDLVSTLVSYDAST